MVDYLSLFFLVSFVGNFPSGVCSLRRPEANRGKKKKEPVRLSCVYHAHALESAVLANHRAQRQPDCAKIYAHNPHSKAASTIVNLVFLRTLQYRWLTTGPGARTRVLLVLPAAFWATHNIWGPHSALTPLVRQHKLIRTELGR